MIADNDCITDYAQCYYLFRKKDTSEESNRDIQIWNFIEIEIILHPVEREASASNATVTCEKDNCQTCIQHDRGWKF